MTADERAKLLPIIESECNGLEGLLDLKMDLLERTLDKKGVGAMTTQKFVDAVKKLRKANRRERKKSSRKVSAANSKDRRASARVLLANDNDGTVAVASPVKAALDHHASEAGGSSKFDVFLSYRVSSEHRETQDVYQGLRAEGLKPYRDKECLEGECYFFSFFPQPPSHPPQQQPEPHQTEKTRP